MRSAPKPDNENERLAELLKYEVLDTEAEEAFDGLTKIAAHICKTPISLVSLIDFDRQWFKSHHGIDAQETPRDLAFCAHAILEDEVFIVEDSSKDERFHDNPLAADAPHVKFYAGTQLTMKSGLKLGTLCVIDHEARKMTDEQIDALVILGKQVVSQLELRRTNRLQEIKNAELGYFVEIVGHDIRAPLRQISSYCHLMGQGGASQDSSEHQHVAEVNKLCTSLSMLIDDVIKLSRCDSDKLETETVDTFEVIQEIRAIHQHDKQVSFTLASDLPVLETNKSMIFLVLQNLINNAIKYCDKEICELDISYQTNRNEVTFAIKDNGLGISEEAQKNIFNKFYRENEDSVCEGSGLGLAIVKKIIDLQGGTISVESTPGTGSTFIFTWPRQVFTDEDS